MPYEVIGSEVQIQKNLSFDKELGIDDREAVIYIQGDIIEDGDVAEHVVKAYDDGDEHVVSLLKRISAAEAKKAEAKPAAAKKTTEAKETAEKAGDKDTE